MEGRVSICKMTDCPYTILLKREVKQPRRNGTWLHYHHHHHHHLIYPLTARVVGALQMISKPDFSIFPCFPPPSGTWPTPGLSILRCCLPTSSSVYLVFFSLSLCLARWFWSDLMNGRVTIPLQFAFLYDGQEVYEEHIFYGL